MTAIVAGRPARVASPAGWEAERPSGRATEAWCYTDRISYASGDRVDVHVHATAAYDLRVIRDGAEPELVLERTALPETRPATPADAYAAGCDWPVAQSFEISERWRSGVYLVVIGIDGPDDVRWEREHFFVVRSAAPGRDTPYALVLATSTLAAYNDWGGANHWRGIGEDPREEVGSPALSLRRPIARGLLRKAAGAPRASNRFTPEIGFTPRYPAYEWARLHGYGRHHAEAGWATYERPFALWAQANGFELDVVTQHDLDSNPTALDGYRCAVIVGHDACWSWEMRDTLDRFVESGGNVARFAGGLQWQVRLEDGGATQVHHRLPQNDPGAADRPERSTTLWDATSIGRPVARSLGLSGALGTLGRVGATTPRSSGGFTVYRHDHWLFDGADLFYGDELGALPAAVATGWLDAAEVAFSRGLPVATGEDGAPQGLEVLAVAPAADAEPDRWDGHAPLAAPRSDRRTLLDALGSDLPAHLRQREQGAGMIAVFERGGTVVNIGASEWVAGLIAADSFVERITGNALRRLGGIA